jgi:hypothetical protein
LTPITIQPITDVELPNSVELWSLTDLSQHFIESEATHVLHRHQGAQQTSVFTVKLHLINGAAVQVARLVVLKMAFLAACLVLYQLKLIITWQCSDLQVNPADAHTLLAF